MKAALTITVSRKGGKDCLARIDKWCGALNETECNADNCPLEIQDDNKFTELEEACLERIGALIVENAMLKEHN